MSSGLPRAFETSPKLRPAQSTVKRRDFLYKCTNDDSTSVRVAGTASQFTSKTMRPEKIDLRLVL